MANFLEQYRRPIGQQGRKVAALMNREHRQLTKWGLSYVNIESNDLILDVGCGGGKTISQLAQIVPNGAVYGLDYSLDMVKYSRRLNRKLIAKSRTEIIVGSVEKMSFPEGFFDLVTAFETYYFWNNFTKTLAEIKRVLKPAGRLLMTNEMIMDGTFEVVHKRLIEKTHVRLLPLSQIRKYLQFVGFGTVQVFRKADSPWNAVLAKKD